MALENFIRLTFAMTFLFLVRFVTPEATSATHATTCPASDRPKLRNSAFVFIKPHANTPATRTFVKDKLIKAGIIIVSEVDIDGNVIDERQLIDKHYYSIASKATILPAKDIPVPKDKFQEHFGEAWDIVLMEDRACNAMEACKRLDSTPSELNDAWQAADVVKFGGGFYCGKWEGAQMSRYET